MTTYEYAAVTERVLSPGEVAEVVPVSNQPQAWEENLNVHLICRECKEIPPNIVDETSAGDMVCGSCGLVLQSHVVDTRSEWRTFSNDDQGNDDPSRVGEAANPLLNGSQLSSSIAFSPGDARSKDLIRAQNRSSEHKGNKQLMAAYRTIDAYASIINMSTSAINSCKQLYKMTEDSKQFRGKSQETIIAGCLFISCRHSDAPRTFKEIHTLTKVPKKEIGRTFKVLETFFKTEDKKARKNRSNLGEAGYVASTSTPANELCGRFGNSLGLSTLVSLMAGKSALKMLKNGELAGRSPLSVAAVALYVISYFMGTPKTPKEISLICGISDGTIRGAWKKIYDFRMEFLEDSWLQQGGKLENLPPL